MSILKNIQTGVQSILPISQKSAMTRDEALLKAIKDEVKKGKLTYTPKAMGKTRKDMKDWHAALSALFLEVPKTYSLQLLYENAMTDSLLHSQIENRLSKIFGLEFQLVKPNGETDDEQTLNLLKNCAYVDITKAILEILYVDYNLVQLHLEKNMDGITFVRCETLPRTNVTPQNGRFYIDYTIEDKFVEYRNLKEYGVYLLEFDSGKRGLVNKAIPHFLMKNFAQSCWAELCEIYGIPPRWIKTNTQDKQMLDRAETMMRDFGAAAWWIIDSTEEFGFAQNAINATGEVYKNLINLCNNEISLLISGAIIAQDTVNGNRSKDESAREVLMERVEQDLRFAAEQWNRVVLPALKRLGMIKGELEFRYVVPEDKDALWKKVVEALPYYDVEPEWVEDKFGIKVMKKANPVSGGNLGIAQSFFD